MLSRSEARQLVELRLREHEEAMGIPLALLDAEPRETPTVWVFHYNSAEFLDTGRFSSRLAGNGPFVVVRQTGQVLQAGTGRPLEWFLSNLEETGNLWGVVPEP